MKKAVLYSLISIIGFGVSDLFAQQTQYWCGTDKHHVELMKSNAQYRESREQIEQQWRTFVQNNPVFSKTTGAPVFTIPVVFHVIHNYGPENISKDKILTEMDYLNKSFQNMWADSVNINPPFKPLLADCQIEFKLAQIDPWGNCTDGITRTVSDYTYGQDNLVKGLIKWPSNKYMNIWVVADLANPGTAAYATYPANNNPNDGIVTRYSFVGAQSSNYNERVLTHEVGHWLNLPHTWGSTNDPGLPQNCSNDDFVADTPNTIGVANFSCSYNQVTCNSLDMVENYMDYASCSYMFTWGQKTRMHNALNSPTGGRNNLSSTQNLNDTGTDPGFNPPPCQPIADIKKDNIYLCTGESHTFYDLSWRGDPTNWQWDFPGGTPSTSGDKNPVVTYNTPGVYDVTLTVSNGGGSDAITVNGMVIVSPSTASNTLPYSEDFENVTIPNSSDWIIENDASGTEEWQLSTAAAKSGTHAMRLLNYTSGNANQGTADAFVTPAYNFTNIINGSLTFELAFATLSTSSGDQLRVLASPNCGKSWAPRYTKNGLALTTAGLVFTPFTPTAANQWRTETVNVGSSSFNNQPSVRFKFEYTQDNGNNIYIDDLNITGTSTVGIQDVVFLATMNIFPNPANESATVAFSLSEGTDVRVEVIDIAGRVVETAASRFMAPGSYQFTIGEQLPSGSYFVRFTLGSNNLTQKFIKL